MRNWSSLVLVSAMTIGLAACAGDPWRDGDAGLRPADRPECQVSSSTDGLPHDGAGSSASRERCNPGESLKWTPGQRDTIKPDFSGSRDG